MRRRTFLGAGAALLTLPGRSWSQGTIGGDEALKIAREVYIYAYPVVQNYLTIYEFALDRGGSQYRGRRTRSTTSCTCSRPRIGPS
jgi:hypothetical protein